MGDLHPSLVSYVDGGLFSDLIDIELGRETRFLKSLRKPWRGLKHK